MIIYSNFGDLILIIYNANKKVHSLEKEKKHGALIDLRARPPQVKKCESTHHNNHRGHRHHIMVLQNAMISFIAVNDDQ